MTKRPTPDFVLHDSQMREELTLVQARADAKEMACRRECGQNLDGTPMVKHTLGCPLWEPNYERKL